MRTIDGMVAGLRSCQRAVHLDVPGNHAATRIAMIVYLAFTGVLDMNIRSSTPALVSILTF
ncbi:hypothetical protein [Salinarimonas soli]|uniref:Uncharacterized protein n=1 Tax=Salinarimonas soli TaxID=1638099 RepID=A0A5B2VBL5_9HYPH|nr:hypothetical protein [Salinarimonas soli]KAA2236166.1 hypothetical protein F0L46_15755 [Salinarimonas soli]